MTRTWIDAVLQAAGNGAIVRAVVVQCRGSCPREVGADMLIGESWTEGTVGGGALEHDVIATARAMLAEPSGPWQRSVRTYHLGPDLNQCCGGAAMVLLERFGESERNCLERLSGQSDVGVVVRPLTSGAPISAAIVEQAARLIEGSDGVFTFEEAVTPTSSPLVIYGAGHVARAVVRALDGLPFSVMWIDIADDRFPNPVPPGVAVIVSAEPAAAVADMGRDAYHLVMTHSHELDEAIVTAVLRHGAFCYLGMIGSETKAARFRQRLARSGNEPDLIKRLMSPIGLAGLAGKAPAVIAASVAADLLLRRSRAANGD